MTMKIICADITTLTVDAIVNAANTTLLGGGGVDGAIHKAAGQELLEECRALGGCKTGEAKITKGYNLPAAYVIHTPGPIYRGGNCGEAVLLENSYRNSLIAADEFHCKSVAFPCISAGVYGYPIKESAFIALTTVHTYLQQNNSDMTVYFVCFKEETAAVYRKILAEILRNHV
ncbi:MAG: O-acetyl-ADP-ribose deacetylase [Treponema sp.]